ncbi:MAG: hypothetical protein ACI9KE_004136 [Polyangiales bacterium]|jgi:hypothetical protein
MVSQPSELLAAQGMKGVAAPKDEGVAARKPV